MLRSDLAESIRICKKNGALFVRFFHVSSPLLDLKVSSKSSPHARWFLSSWSFPLPQTTHKLSFT